MAGPLSSRPLGISSEITEARIGDEGTLEITFLVVAASSIIIALGILSAALLYSLLSYISATVGLLKWSGFEDKTLWDVIEVALVPFTLAVGGYLFARGERIAEQARTMEHSRDRAIEAYLDSMTDLIVNHDLASSGTGRGLKATARARTISLLEQLDGPRKAQVLRFLYEAGLITRPSPVVPLSGANLGGLLLAFASLPKASLRGANLRRSQLLFVDLTNADLSDAHFVEAQITRTTFAGADLSRADFTAATLTATDLTAAIVKGTKFKGIDPHAFSLRQALRARPVNAEFTAVTIDDVVCDDDTAWPDGQPRDFSKQGH